jgi:hypothetical protein
MTAQPRARITLAMILLVYGKRLPGPVRKVVFRVYRRGADARLWVQAARPARFRLMCSEGLGEPAERLRWTGQYRIPIATAAEAVGRLVESERRHPECRWWIERGDPGARWHRPRRFDEDFAGYLEPRP